MCQQLGLGQQALCPCPRMSSVHTRPHRHGRHGITSTERHCEDCRVGLHTAELKRTGVEKSVFLTLQVALPLCKDEPSTCQLAVQFMKAHCRPLSFQSEGEAYISHKALTSCEPRTTTLALNRKPS